MNITFYKGEAAKWAIGSVLTLQCCRFSTSPTSDFEAIARYFRFINYAKNGGSK